MMFKLLKLIVNKWHNKGNLLMQTFHSILYEFIIKKKILLYVIISGGLAIYLLYGNFFATWGMIDDHQIMFYLSSFQDGNNYIQTLLTTEVGKWGQFPRYRPSYYSLRLLETLLWGDQVALWYIFRIFIFSFFIFTILFIIGDLVGPIFAFLFLLSVLSTQYLGDIFARLGPAEVYAILGMSLYLIGIYLFYIKKFSNKILYLMLLGSLISMGSKENFLIIALFSIYFILFKWGEISKLERIIHFVIILFALFIAIGVMVAIANNGGEDIYNRDASLFSRLLIVVSNIITMLKQVYLQYFIMGMIIIVSYSHKINELSKIKTTAKQYLLFLSISLVLLISQIFFYNGIPSLNRYSFPYILIEQAFILGSIIYLSKMLYLIYTNKTAVNIFILTLMLVLLPISYDKIISLRNSSMLNASKTKIFYKKLQKTVKLAQLHPEYTILLTPHSTWNKEPIVSTIKYLRYYGIQNNISLNINMMKQVNKSQLHKRLYRQIKGWGKKGILVNHYNYITNLVNFPSNEKKCISVSFSGDSSDQCKYKVRIWK